MKKLIVLLFGLFLVVPVFAGGSHHHGGDGGGTTPPPPTIETSDGQNDNSSARRGFLIGVALICVAEYVAHGINYGKWDRMCFTGYSEIKAAKDENPDSIVPVTANPSLYGVSVKEKK